MIIGVLLRERKKKYKVVIEAIIFCNRIEEPRKLQDPGRHAESVNDLLVVVFFPYSNFVVNIYSAPDLNEFLISRNPFFFLHQISQSSESVR